MISDAGLLEARNLGRRHPDGRGWLLDGVSLRLDSGQRLAIVGASGSGKTLLLRALALLDPLDQGAVYWQGRSIRRDLVPSFRRQVVYLHQRPALLPGTVETALKQPFFLKAYRRHRFDRALVVGLLEQLGRNPSFLSKPVRELSGGESQMTALVRALELDPAVLLLDEPTAALDANTARSAEGLVCRWVDQSPECRAVLWVSHDATQARRVAQRTLAMQAGRFMDSR